MQIKDYLKDNDIKQSAFALSLGVTQGLVSQWINGTTAITPKKARLIELATNKQILAIDLIFGSTA